MTAWNSTLMPACSCSRQSFHAPGLLPWAPPYRVVLLQGLFVLKPQADQVPGDHSPLLRAGRAVPGLGQAKEYKQSPVANRLSCSPGPWPAGRPSWAGTCHPALAGIPLASSLSSAHSAFGLWLPQHPSLSELSSGFIFGRSCILSPYLLLPSGKVWDPWARLGIRLWFQLLGSGPLWGSKGGDLQRLLTHLMLHSQRPLPSSPHPVCD